jgi:putative peptidoglycan lipid II flippase
VSEQPKQGHEGRIARNAGVLVFFTMLSRIAGLIRDFCITHFFGATGLTDVFYMAFTIPNVMRRLVAEGTLTVTFQPHYVEVRERDGPEAARRFAASVLGFVLVFVAVLSALGVLAAPQLVTAFASGFRADPEKFALTVELTRWMFPVIFFISLVALSMAILNAHDVYGAPALAPVVMNLAMIAMTVVGALTFERPIMGIVVGVLLGGALQLAVQVPPLVKRGLLVWPRGGWGDPDVKSMLLGFIPGLFTLAVYQVNIIVLRQIASYLPEGSVSYYYTSDRLMELTNGVFAIAIAQGAFTSMGEIASRLQRAGADDEQKTRELASLKQVWRFSFKLQNMIAIPAAVGLAVMAKPIVSLLFLHGRFTWADVEQTAQCVLWASPGLVATATVRGTAQVFYAMKDRVTPALVSVVVVLSNLGVGLLSMRLGFGIAGLSGTLAVSNILQASLLVLLLRRKIGALQAGSIVTSGIAKIALALAAGGAAWGVALLGDWPRGFGVVNAVVLTAAIGAAVLVYGAGAVLLRFEGVDTVTAKIARKLRRGRAPR